MSHTGIIILLCMYICNPGSFILSHSTYVYISHSTYSVCVYIHTYLEWDRARTSRYIIIYTCSLLVLVVLFYSFRM